MKDELFAELVASVKEGGQILRGEKEAARTFYYDRLDILRIRENIISRRNNLRPCWGSVCVRCGTGNKGDAFQRVRRWFCCV